MITFDYLCSNCGDLKNNHELNSMACACGGSFTLYSGPKMQLSNFQPYFCPTLKQMVYSWKDAEKKAREHRSYAHPEGFTLIQENKKWLNELKYIRKHKEDYKAATQPGYKPGQKHYDDQAPDRHRAGRRKYFIAASLALLLLSTPLDAAVGAFDNIEFATIEVKGEEIRFPIGNKERKQEVYYLKKALRGDMEAREVFMGGAKEKFFFVGVETPLWLKMTESDVEIIKP